ncbi:hypothetical protein, partial [Leptospira ognonensis]|uniref:hypothetical protein n=1 Tax=Leptospira ognonensis TaxID=2484945 RepID=UPI001AEF5406
MISDWVNTGKLKFIRARIQKVHLQDESLKVSINTTKGQQLDYEVDRLINCTGPDTQLKESKNNLYTNLIKKGYIRNSENGIGFKTLSG